MKSNWKDYFIFSEKELKAIVVIGVFIIASAIVSLLFPAKKKSIQLFYFDPNTLDSIAAMQLGCMPKQFTTLSNFRKKGGRFYTAKDIFKWYGLKASQLEQLYPYVRIASVRHPSFSKAFRKDLLDINKAEVADLERIGFIHPRLANRIIKYRAFLGGFSSLGQLQKVYGMNDSLFRQLLPFLSLQRGVQLKMHWPTMNYKQLVQLGVFEQREVWRILRDRKELGKAMDWASVVVQFDLSKEQANKLKARTDIQ